MKEKCTLHIIAIVMLVVFVVLGLACASAPAVPFEKMKEEWVKPENNKFKIDKDMADKKVPIELQCFLYMDSGFAVKNKIFSFYTSRSFTKSIAVLPLDSTRLWARFEEFNSKYEMEITFTSQKRSVLSVLGGQDNLEAPSLEPGQSYLLFDPVWVERRYKSKIFQVITLDKEGIEYYTKGMWSLNSGKLSHGTKADWSSYEEYRDYVIQVWEITKEETRKQLN